MLIEDIVLFDGDNKVGLSCKSCKETRTHLNVSSYRMTTCNTTQDFIQCIDTERANFAYYSVIARLETDKTITYSVYFIPATLVKASDLQWTEKYSKKHVVTGWITAELNGVQMSVTKSMSNQLWIKLQKEKFKGYRLIDNLVVKKEKQIDYASLFDKLSLADDVDACVEVTACSSVSSS